MRIGSRNSRCPHARIGQIKRTKPRGAGAKQITLVATLTVACWAANAQEKVWKHGILEAKSDSGFIAMVEKGGFGAKHGLKVELLKGKAGAKRMRARVSRG